jgi:hypothetical protein
MRSLLLLITLSLIIISCSKDNKDTPEPSSEVSGKWIEKTQRLDTIDFEPGYPGTMGNNKVLYLQAKPFMDPSVSTVYPRIYSSMYGYYFEQNYIYLRSFFSSSLAYNKYSFRWTTGRKSFIVKKFYDRKSLPSEIEFIPLK